MLDVAPEDLRAAVDHYEETLGGLPDSMQVLSKDLPAVFEGYARMRRAVFAADSEIPVRYKELIFVLLDLATGNIEGATIHARAGVGKGLTLRELSEGLGQALLVLGVSSWDRGGAAILRAAGEMTHGAEQ